MSHTGCAEAGAGRADAPAAVWGSLTFLIVVSPPRAAEPPLTHPILILQHGPATRGELSHGEEEGERF